jgi:hypothetical protein
MSQSQLMRWGAWVGIVMSIGLLAVYFGTARCLFSWVLPRSLAELRVSAGMCEIVIPGFPERAAGIAMVGHSSRTWCWSFSRTAEAVYTPTTAATVDIFRMPMWPAALGSAVVLCVLPRLRIQKRRRLPVGGCTVCGYDRAGLTLEAKCPECGLSCHSGLIESSP